MRKSVQAIIWDFDGTLADTGFKNFNVTRAIVSALRPEAADSATVVTRREEYERCHRQLANWREFYVRHLGFTEEQTDEAGRMWSDFQLRDQTRTPLYTGILETLQELRSYPHGVVSQNARTIIERALAQARVDRLFRAIVGYEEVPIRKQKPAPEGLLLCLKQLVEAAAGAALFIGDHLTDVLTVQNANRAFQQTGTPARVFSVAVAYSKAEPANWPVQPDYIVRTPRDVIEVKETVEAKG